MTTNERLHALDAVRAFALLAGIVLHATMSFFLPIPVADSSQSETLSVTFFVIHIFRMSLFYMIAGFFGRMMLERRGARAFIKDRSRRIAVPLVGGWVLLAPLTIGAIVWGATRAGASFDELEASAEALPSGFPLIHLWFLYYLIVFYAIALAVSVLLAPRVDASGSIRRRLDGAFDAALTGWLGPFLIGAPLLAVLYFMEQPLWGGIPTPDVGLVPQVPALVGFGTAFALGWLLHRQLGLLERFRTRWTANLAIAAVLTVVCLSLTEISIDPGAVSAQGPWRRVAYAACYTAAIWYWSFGLIGAALRFCSEASAARRYLADASYWMYLVHLPIVFFLQAAVAGLPWHWTIKFPLIVAVTVGVALVTYHYLVRSTFVGSLLNGRRYPRGGRLGTGPRPGPHAPTPPAGGRTDAPVAAIENVTHRYGDTVALAGVDLAVERGELLAVLGPNGAGKSTAISLWLGMLEPDAGSVSLLGESPLDTTSRLEVGVMLQEVGLTPQLKARELVELTASYYPDPMPVDEALALTQTTALADKRYDRMSAGQKRQIQFAAAVCGRPRLLFLDEPTVGLDVKARQTMWTTIRGLVAQGCSIVLTTHYLEEAEALADRVAVLARGRLIALGSVAEMRALVSRKQIRCTSASTPDEIRRWPSVVDAVRDDGFVRITAVDAESVVRRLLAADESLSNLEVRQASLAEAFTELTDADAADVAPEEEAA